eukprot:TRINITY_DN1245_c0_g1_i1.p1 TRINITY_DN1245_c0_g1~~TRINITY_DN1245_c0_g1_i1.p1  ORF type:complete len:1038 (-),score=409.79 TRINITY_DN1245_c0_g1_i1:221-3250(-)
MILRLFSGLSLLVALSIADAAEQPLVFVWEGNTTAATSNSTGNSTGTSSGNSTSTAGNSTGTSTTTGSITTGGITGTTGSAHKFGPVDPAATLLFEAAGQTGLTAGAACSNLSFLAQLRDADGFNVTVPPAGTNVSLQLWSLAGVAYEASVSDVGGGLFAAQYSTPLAGHWYVQLLVDALPSDPHEVTIKPTFEAAATSVFEQEGDDGLHGGPFNTSLLFWVQLRDCAQLPYTLPPGRTVNVSVDLADSTVNVFPQGGGLYQVVYEAHRLGPDQNLTVYVNNTVVGSYLVNISLVPPPPPPGIVDPQETVVYQRDGDRGLIGGQAGSPLTFVVQLRDSLGDNITWMLQPWNVTVKLPEVQPNVTVTPLNADGLVQVQYVPGLGVDWPQMMWVWVNGDPVRMFYVNISRSPAVLDLSNTLLFEADNQTGLTYGVSLQPLAFTMQLRDQYNGNWSVPLAAQLQCNLTGLWPAGVLPTFSIVPGGNTGVYVVTYSTPWFFKPNEHKTLTVSCNGARVLQQAEDVEVVPAVADANKTLLWPAPASSMSASVAGVPLSFYVLLRDSAGSNISYPRPYDYNVSVVSNSSSFKGACRSSAPGLGGWWQCNVTLTVATASMLTVQLNGLPLPGLVYVVETVANVADKRQLNPKTMPIGAIAGTTYNFTMWTRDGWGNAVDPSAVDLQFNVTSGGRTVFTAESVGGGLWLGFVSFTKATNDTWLLWLNGANISGRVGVFPGPVDPRGFTANPQSSRVNGSSTFFIQVCDQFSNPLRDYAPALPVVTFASLDWSPAGPPTATPPHAVVVPRDVGQYMVTYGATQAGQYAVSVTVQGTPIADSPFEIYIAPGSVYPTRCSASGAGVGSAASNVVSLNAVNFFTITSRDLFGNPTGLQGGEVYQGTVQSYYGTDVSKVFIVDNLDGTYAASYEIEHEGNYWIVVQHVEPAPVPGTLPVTVPIDGSPYLVATYGAPSPPTFSAGALAGSIVGVFFGAVLLALLAAFIVYRYRMRHAYTVVSE